MIAEAAILGLPVDRFMRSEDPDELALLHAARKEGAQVLDDILTNLARKIVNEQAAAEKRARK